jgi:hypothetical protein
LEANPIKPPDHYAGTHALSLVHSLSLDWITRSLLNARVLVVSCILSLTPFYSHGLFTSPLERLSLSERHTRRLLFFILLN